MAVPNSWNPKFDRVEFNADPVIFSGTASGVATIVAEVGLATPGCIYISSYGSGEIWVGLSSVWTQLTIN